MKILFLNTYFHPEIVASSYIWENLRTAFADEGFEMELYTPTPTRGISAEMRTRYKKINYEEQLGGKLKIHRFFMFTEGRNPVLRAFRYFLLTVIHFYKGLRSKKIDVIFITSTPPIKGAMGALLKKVKKVPLVYILQDIFPDSLVATNLTRKNSILWKIGRLIEDFTYRNADKIIVISEDFKKNIMGKGVPEEKVSIIYNWVDENVVVNVSRINNNLFDKYNLDRNKFYLTYCGNIGLTQNMDMLLDVAKELESFNEIQFVLIGEGAYKKAVKNLILQNKIKNVELLPFQSYEKISNVFSLGDVGLVISKPGVGDNSVPSKTWSIMSAERPVLASFDENELKRIIIDNNCGIFTKANDKEAFKEAILMLYAQPEKCRELGINGRKFVLKNLTRAKGTSSYVKIIKQLMD